MPPAALAIILARAGSKGLPGKNMLPVAGKPCAQWTIEHAQRSKKVGEVVVSTDDPRLIMLARELRAGLVERPPELASDTATIDAAARHALATIERARGKSFDPGHSIVILYANVPVRPADLTDRAVEMLVESGADSVQSYSPVGKHHPWWTARVDSGTGEVRPWEGDVLNHGVFRRQDLPPAYIPDGGVIAVTRAALMLEVPGVREGPHAFFGREDRRRGIVSGSRGDEVVDIDGEIELRIADAILTQEQRECEDTGSATPSSLHV